MPDSLPVSRWIVRPHPQSNPKLRHFCFPYAGGGASLFRNWWKFLPENVEVCCIQPPGREERICEAPFRRVPDLVAALAVELAPWLDRPFAFFGHSLGGLLSFECARRLRSRSGLLPEHLFISACRAPHLPLARKPIHALPTHAFTEELRRLNGTPEMVLKDREVMELMEPVLRADFALYETYQYAEEAPFRIPVSAFGGLQDGEVSKDAVEAWQVHSLGGFHLQMFTGDHFYIHHAHPAVLRSMARELSLITSRGGSPVAGIEERMPIQLEP
ncbi:MAG TPA: thioesterase domain-containing protein [Terracidiphilus sp.]|nr:thioesterase domain-containing protein [Terracidiphilus sp.]